MGAVGFLQSSATVSIPLISSNTMRKAISKPAVFPSALLSSARRRGVVSFVSSGYQRTNIPPEFPGKTPDINPTPTPPIPPEVPGFPREPSPPTGPPDVPFPGQPNEVPPPKLPPDPDVLPPTTPPDFPPPDMPPDINPPVGPSILL